MSSFAAALVRLGCSPPAPLTVGAAAPAAPVLFSQVTGSTLGDALVGGGLGYLLAKPDNKKRAAAIGGVLTVLGGVTGLLATGVYLAWQAKPRRAT